MVNLSYSQSISTKNLGSLNFNYLQSSAGEIVSQEQKESEDVYIEEIGTVYGENQAPENLAVPIGESITIDLLR